MATRALTNQEILDNQIDTLRRNMAACEAEGGEWVHFVPCPSVPAKGMVETLLARYAGVDGDCYRFSLAGTDALVHFDGRTICRPKLREKLTGHDRIDPIVIEAFCAPQSCFCDYCMADRETNADARGLGEEQLCRGEAPASAGT